jgi:hypothetical protein
MFKIFGQHKTGRSWGYLVQVASQTSILVSVVNLCLIAVTAYSTTISPWLLERGMIIPFWFFVAGLSMLILVMALVLYKFAVPSYFNAFNEQFYKHDNPLRDDIELIKKTQAEILEKLTK